nr:DUF2663 family protein [Fredinandcohnia sp. SECRCQ15]
MLQHSLKRKRKYEMLKRRSTNLKLLTLFLLTCFLIYIMVAIIKPNSHSAGNIVSIFLNNGFHFFVVILIGGLYGGIRFVDKKKDEAEDKYHAIRCEIIDKSKDLWKQPDQWKEREFVFEMMKREFDVNLYHESK